MNEYCRICFGENDLISLKCKCVDKIHYSCASEWFTKDIDVKLSGKLKGERWTLDVSVNCEVCKEKIDRKLTFKMYHEFDKQQKILKNKK